MSILSNRRRYIHIRKYRSDHQPSRNSSLPSLKMIYRTTPSITFSSGISLSKIPTLRGRDNYTEWAREIPYPLKTINTWEFTLGERKIPDIPSYLYDMQKRPTDLIQRRR